MVNSHGLRRTQRITSARKRIAEATSLVSGKIHDIRTSIISERQNSLEKYPYLKEFVTITNDGVNVRTCKGDLEFGYGKYDNRGYFPSRDLSPGNRLLREQYIGDRFSYDKLDILITLFGQSVGPYESILGLKSTPLDNGNKNYSSIYWTSTAINDSFAHIFHLEEGNIFLVPSTHFVRARYFPI